MNPLQLTCDVLFQLRNESRWREAHIAMRSRLNQFEQLFPHLFLSEEDAGKHAFSIRVPNPDDPDAQRHSMRVIFAGRTSSGATRWVLASQEAVPEWLEETFAWEMPALDTLLASERQMVAWEISPAPCTCFCVDTICPLCGNLDNLATRVGQYDPQLHESMTLYKARAEFPRDVIVGVNLLCDDPEGPQRGVRVVEVRPSHPFMDAELVFASRQSLEDIREHWRMARDLHVMIQTVQKVEDYSVKEL